MPEHDPDPRIHAIRADAAAETLKSIAGGRRLLTARAAIVMTPFADVMKTPDSESEMISQFLYGEIVDCYETRDGWSWCQSRRDGYVGYVEEAALSSEVFEGEYRVAVASAACHTAPDPESPQVFSVPLNARLSVTGKVSANGVVWRKSSAGLWVTGDSISKDNARPDEFLDILKLFLGTRYLWGGKTIWGIDCSGLVQMGLDAVGIECPRDTDLQKKHFSAQGTLAFEKARGGDVVWMPKHVAVLIDDQGNAIHADGVGMVVHIQPLREILSRRKLALEETIICRVL